MSKTHVRIGNLLSLQNQLLSPCGKSRNDRAEKMALKRILNDLGLKIGVSLTHMNKSLVLNPFDLTLLMNAPSLAKLTGEFAGKHRCCIIFGWFFVRLRWLLLNMYNT